MNAFMNEEVMWQRLKDIQREAENSRLFVEGTLPGMARTAGLLARRAWWLAGLALRRTPRRSALRIVEARSEETSRVA